MEFLTILKNVYQSEIHTMKSAFFGQLHFIVTLTGRFKKGIFINAIFNSTSELLLRLIK